MPYRLVNEPPEWAALNNQPVRIYRNLNTHWITIQSRLPGKGWRVAGCTQTCWLQSVRFEIDRKRHAWILQHQRRTVCAWASGILIAPIAPNIEQTPIAVGYNPFRQKDFYDKHTGIALNDRCEFLAVIDNEVFASADALSLPACSNQSKWHQPNLAITVPPLEWRWAWA